MDRATALRIMKLTSVPNEDGLKSAYRKRARIVHPDVHGTGDEDAFRELKKAVGVLQTCISEFLADDGGSDPEQVIQVEINLADLVNGQSIRVKGGKCPLCDEGYRTLDEPQPCLDCRGLGFVTTRQGMITSRKPCNACTGRGKVTSIRCLPCAGTGRTAGGNADYVLPCDAVDGDEVRVGRGEAALCLLVRVHMPAGVKRRGHDILMNVMVPFDVLCLGGHVEAIDAGGRGVVVEVPAGTPSGGLLTVADGGIPKANKEGRGKMFLKLVALVPEKLSKDQRECLLRWRDLA